MLVLCYVTLNLASNYFREFGQAGSLKTVLELTSHRHERRTLLHQGAIHEPDAVVERDNSSEYFVVSANLRPDQDDDVYSGTDGYE